MRLKAAIGGRLRHHPYRSALVASLVFVLALTLVVVAVGFYLQQRLAGQVNRVEGVFTGLENRPEKPTEGPAAKAINILLMGTDRRSDEATTGSDATDSDWIPGAQRTDTIMVLHIDGDRQGGSLISIPRDSWVEVPGHGPNKVNAAFSLAGPSLAVATIEDVTGLRIDHLAVIDWAGFAAITDALGGVEVKIPETTRDSHHDVTWTEGTQRLNGEQALLYVRQRYGLPNGDLDRVRRQQAYLRSLTRATMSTVGDRNPGSIYDLLDTLTRNISLDEEWSVGDLRGLLLDLRKLRASDLDLITVPVQGLGREGAQSVVYLDDPAGRDLWQAVRNDQVDPWVSRHPEEVLSGPAA